MHSISDQILGEVSPVATSGESAIQHGARNLQAFLTQLAGTTISLAIVARVLGPSEMGIYSFFLWLASVVAALANFGLPTALTKYIAEMRGAGRPGDAAQLGRQGIWLQTAMALGSAAAVAISVYWAKDKLPLLVTGLLIVPLSLREVFAGVLAGYQDFEKLARVNLVAAVLQVAAVATAWRLHCRSAGMLLAITVSSAATVLIMAKMARARAAGVTAVALDPALRRRLRRFVLAAGIAGLLYVIVWQRPELLFLKAYGEPAQIAFFTIGFTLASRLLDVSHALTNVLMPITSARLGDESAAQRLDRVFARSVRCTQLAFVPLCFAAMALAGPVVELLCGSSYLPVVPVLQLLVLGVAVSSVAGIALAMLCGADQLWTQIQALWPVAVLNLVAAYVIIPKLGSTGAAAVKLAVFVVATCVVTWPARRRFHAAFPWASTLRIYGASCLAWAPALVLGWVGAPALYKVGGLAVGAAGNLLLLMAAGEIGAEERQLARALVGVWRANRI